MLTAIAALILIALIVIGRDIAALTSRLNEASRCSSCRGTGHARGAPDPQEPCGSCMGECTATAEANRSLGLILGKLSDMHHTILELWACPTCSGSGKKNAWDHLSDPAWNPMEPCETCKGSGMKQDQTE